MKRLSYSPVCMPLLIISIRILCSTLCFILAMGSKDNDIILWDVVGETGMFRLRGHGDQVPTIFKLAITYFHF